MTLQFLYQTNSRDVLDSAKYKVRERGTEGGRGGWKGGREGGGVEGREGGREGGRERKGGREE